MKKEYDVIIIGAGVIGAAVGFELAKKGHKTLNIDKLSDSGYGSTSNSCAIIRTHYSTWNGVAMAYEGYHYWKDWENYLGAMDEKGLVKFHETGCLMFNAPDNNWSTMKQNYIDIGVAFEELNLEQVKKRFNLYNFDSFWPPARPEDPTFFEKPKNELAGAIFTPCAGYINDPQLSTHNFQRAAEAKGGEFLFNSEIVKIRRSNNRVQGVTLADGEDIDAPVVVNVAGPHSFIINRMAGVEEDMNVKTKALRHEVHYVPAPENVNLEKDRLFTTDGDSGMYFRSEAGNMFLVGSEDPDCDKREWIKDPDDFNREITSDQYKAQVYRLARRVNDLAIPNKQQGVAELYDCSDDWIPIYDKSSLDGFYMAIGTSGNQYKNAPIVGHMMAEMIEASEKGIDQDTDPIQVTGPYTGLVLDSGFYSRKRKINPNSSFSVRG